MIYIGNFRRPVFKSVFITFSRDGILGAGKGTDQISDVLKNSGVRFSGQKNTSMRQKLRQN